MHEIICGILGFLVVAAKEEGPSDLELGMDGCNHGYVLLYLPVSSTSKNPKTQL